MSRSFERFVAIDWSGARDAFQRGIAIAECGVGDAAPVLIAPPDRDWSRTAVLGWLQALADAGTSALVGLDLSPAFPFRDAGGYFPGWPDSPADMPALWALVERLCAGDPHLGADGFVTDAYAARHFRKTGALGDLFPGGRGRLRETEKRQLQLELGLSPSSCFNLVGAAQVGKSSLTGMRVLHRLRHGVGARVPLWPLDEVPSSGPVLVEIYTTIAALNAGRPRGRAKMRDGDALDVALAKIDSKPSGLSGRLDDHKTDAILSAAWLRIHANDTALWDPKGLDAVAATEGWTFGVR